MSWSWSGRADGHPSVSSWSRSTAIAVGGAVGSLARAGVDVLVTDVAGFGSWPLATLLVNLVGAFVLGVLVARLRPSTWADGIRVGALGSFTTFSALVVEVVGLVGRPVAATGYLAASLVGGLALAALGLRVGRAGPGRQGPATSSWRGLASSRVDRAGEEQT